MNASVGNTNRSNGDVKKHEGSNEGENGRPGTVAVGASQPDREDEQRRQRPGAVEDFGPSHHCDRKQADIEAQEKAEQDAESLTVSGHNRHVEREQERESCADIGGLA